jgi:hypothetical protein
MEVKYNEEQIQTVIDYLNKLTIVGLSNANIVMNIVNILSNPIVDEEKKKE